jgi:hypothetical protein
MKEFNTLGCSSDMTPRKAPLLTVKHYCSYRDGLEQISRTEHDWTQFRSWYTDAKGLERIDVLKALAASYRAEHAEVPDWVYAEVSAEKAKTTLNRPTKPTKRK